MAEASAAPRRRSPLLRTAGIVASVGVIATAIIVAPGYEVQETPSVETSVWVTRDDGQYAQVDTELGEFEAVRTVSDPSDVVQAGTRGIVFAQAYGQAWAITGADPADLVDADAEDGTAVAAEVPSGVDTVASAGDTLVYLTDAGEVLLGSLPDADGASSSPYALDPYAAVAAEDDAAYVADAVAIDADGTVVMYSAAESAVRTYRVGAGFDDAVETVPSAPDADSGLAMALVSGRWVLMSADTGEMWISGLSAPIATGAADGAVLQDGSSDRDDALVADSEGLVSVALADGATTRLAEATGSPAAPVVVDGVAYAAWVSTTSGSLWSSDRAEVLGLDVLTTAFDDARAVSPAFRSNGDRAVLTETTTGMVWLVSDGTLLPVDEWDPLAESEEQEGTVEVDDVVEQEPPVAVDDVLGVRAGAVVSLPLLLNDYDPNSKDVLTIDPASLTPVDEGFGEVGLIADDQAAVVSVADTSGTATFTYAVTDGSASSEPATVTLTVVDDDTETAPVWCGTDGCVKEWPTPQVAPGGYVAVDVLSGWVDPEGDPVVLQDAVVEDASAPVTVVPTADGRGVIRHLDENAGDDDLSITVTVADSLGATAQRTLEVQVTSSPTLVASPTAISLGVDETTTVDLADVVSGGSGSYRLVSAVASTGLEELLSVLPSAADGTIDLTAAQEGSFTATYTVEDTATLARQTAVIRVTASAAVRALAAAPLTAFVRPGEDTTVDVLGAVASTGARVLMVQEASTSSAALSVSVVDQAYVRVSATTAAEDTGLLGVADVLIADGTGAAVRTQLTVILLPATHGVGAIAAPDAVTVRAGAQVDIPVLDNDVSPRGERLILHPDVTGSDAQGELAFASDAVVRYVAPTTPGVYTVRYSAYLQSDPTVLDTGTITVTVIAEGANSAPQPRDLEARVLAGQSVRVTIDTAGIDPDGDAVTLSSVSQPEAGSGVVTIGPTGRSIVYQAPEGGVEGGQVELTYAVRDAQGETGTATLRIGVLSDELTDVAPVTYGDNVSVALGSSSPATVQPLTNDRDPLQGELVLTDLRPNAEPGTEEYARLESLIASSTDLEAGIVALRAGDAEGTHSYVYTVESQTSFSTAEGLIVVDVADDPAPDTIAVTDTVVTLENRSVLETDGLDVVDGQVAWTTGNVSGLTLSLWDEAPAGFTVEGSRIVGTLPEEATVVPFVLTGTDAAGNEAVGYGFLRIPALDDMRIQTATGLNAIEVDEDDSVEVVVRDLLGVGAGDAVEIQQGEEFAVQRAAAACTPVADDSLAYAAGREAPWSDTCSLVVRVEGQTTWSVVPIPFTIVPADPQAILGAHSRTVVPGDTETIQMLEQMVSWEGGRVGDIDSLDLIASYSGSAFDVTQSGATLTVVAKADARPGTRETVTVTSSAYGGLSSTITLVVGSAVPDAPVGATLSRQCDVSEGTCTLTIVGVSGEYDPFEGAPRAGLELVGVGDSAGDSARCSVATVHVSNETQVTVTWPSSNRPTGGECAVDFTVADAQGRTGRGTLTIDVLGYPSTPSSVTTQSYGADFVTMLVSLGPAAQSHPSLTGVALYEGDTQVPASCAQSGPTAYLCTVTGLTNGEQHTYTARAVNSVGESSPTSPVTTWAYDQPVVEELSAQTVYRAGRTTVDNGVAALTITAAADVEQFQIVTTGETVARTGATTQAEIVLPVGTHQVQVVPVSRYAPPTTGTSEGQSLSVSVTVAGKPRFDAGSVTATSSGRSLTLSYPDVDANYSTRATSVVTAAWLGSTPSCTMSAAGEAVVTGASATSTTSTVAGLTANERYHVGVCASNGFGTAWLASADTYLTWVAPAAPTGNAEYSVATTPSWDGATASFLDVTAPTWDRLAGFTIYYTYDGGSASSRFSLSPAATQSIAAAYCRTDDPSLCGDTTTVRAANDSPPTTVTVEFPTACYTDGDDPATLVRVSSAAQGAADVSIDNATDEYVVRFRAAFADLPDLRYALERCAIPDPSPDPSTDPSAGTGG
ncbi:Ig-like domain-containing protein [Demequina sp. NBRC 110054]|uniref:Ig-like domain-containing protein n=1 Tax=Demequina sp. NBRC 110054 TaxID=1570343 RepID=UPI0009FDED1C|nr:Ig-like domain-containing protein [Demequina sp. NBRC 110054]